MLKELMFGHWTTGVGKLNCCVVIEPTKILVPFVCSVQPIHTTQFPMNHSGDIVVSLRILFLPKFAVKYVVLGPDEKDVNEYNLP